MQDIRFAQNWEHQRSETVVDKEAQTIIYLVNCLEDEHQFLVHSLEEQGAKKDICCVATTVAQLVEQPTLQGAFLLLGLQEPKSECAGGFLRGLDSLWQLRMKCPSFRWLTIADKEDPVAQFLSLHMGATHFLTRPVDAWSLAASIVAMASEGWSYAGRTFSLLDLVLMGHLLKQTVLFRIRSSQHQIGFVALHRGELCYTRTIDGLSGENALLKMLSWSEVDIQASQPQVVLHQNMKGAFGQIIQTLARIWGVRRKHVRSLSHETPIVELLPLDPLDTKFSTPEINALCESVVKNAHGALACCTIDLNRQMLLGYYHAVECNEEAFLDAVTAAVVEVYRSPTLSNIEDLLSPYDGERAKRMVEDVSIRTASSFFFMRSLVENVVVVVVTKANINQGLGWSILQSACTGLQKLL